MKDKQFQEEINKLEKEREDLLNQLSPDERAKYDEFRKKFSETDHAPDDPTPDSKDTKPNNKKSKS